MPFLPGVCVGGGGMGTGKMSRIPLGGRASQRRVRAEGDRIPLNKGDTPVTVDRVLCLTYKKS